LIKLFPYAGVSLVELIGKSPESMEVRTIMPKSLFSSSTTTMGYFDFRGSMGTVPVLPFFI